MRQQATLLSLYCICSQKANPICCAAGGGALWPRQNGLPLLQSLQKKLGTAVIMITHDLGVIAGMCSRVLVMYGGVVVEEGTVREIFYEPKHPYTWGLLRSIPQKSGEKRKLIPIPGSPPDLIAPPPGCPFVARCPYAMNICNSTLPEMTQLSDTHCARCRLLDEGAPRVVWEGNRE